jgi:hypothetical protein
VCSVVLYTIQGSMISGVEVLVSVMQLMAKKLTGGLKRMVMCNTEVFETIHRHRPCRALQHFIPFKGQW